MAMVKRKPSRTRIFLYPLTVGLFLICCYVISLLALGYNLKIVNGKLIKEKTGTILLATRPGDADVFIDGEQYPKKTPLISFFNLKIDRVVPGEHKIRLVKEGRETWEGIFNVESGMVSWGNYILLLPNEKTASSFNFSNIKANLVSSDNTKELVVTSDEEAKIATFWEINTENKHQRKLIEKQITSDESYLPVAYSNNEERILFTHKKGAETKYEVFEVRENGRFWDLSAIYSDLIENPVFNPRNSEELLFLKNGTIVNLNYVNSQSNVLKDTNVLGLYPQESEMLLVKNTSEDVGLWRIAQNGNTQLIVPTLPVSETYQISSLPVVHSYALLASKTKELIIFNPDEGNYTLKKIAGNVDWFLPSKRSKYIAYSASGNIETYETEKGRYFRALEQQKPESLVWAEDEANLFYVTGNYLKMVNFNGFYNKEITETTGKSITVSDSYNLYYYNENATKKVNDLFVLSLNL